MNIQEFNDRSRCPGYLPSSPEHGILPPERLQAREFNDLPDEFYSPREDEKRGYLGNRRSGDGKSHTGRAAFRMFALVLTAVAIVTVASALSGGTFLPELGAAAAGIVEKLDAPLVDPKPGMDLGAAILAWKGGTASDGNGGDPGDAAPGGDQSDPSPDGEAGDNQNTPAPGGPDGSTPEAGTDKPSGPQDDDQNQTPPTEPDGGDSGEEAGGNQPVQPEPDDGTPADEPSQEPDDGQEDPAQEPEVEPEPEPEPEPVPDADGHIWELVKEKEPTCIRAGYLRYVCSHCGEEKEEELPATGHTFSDWEDSGDGEVHTRTCLVCGVIRRGSHALSNWSDTGSGHSATCSVCGAYVEEGHRSATRTVTRATCTQPGQAYKYCTVCGAQISEIQETSPLGHSWDGGRVTTAATCQTTGVMTYTCTRCGATRTETIPLGDHVWSAWATTIAPTCTTAGEEARTCTICGARETRTAEAKGHSWEGQQSDASGFVTASCSVCGGSISLGTPTLIYDAVNVGVSGSAPLQLSGNLSLSEFTGTLSVTANDFLVGNYAGQLGVSDAGQDIFVLIINTASANGTGVFTLNITAGGTTVLTQTYQITVTNGTVSVTQS